MTHGFQQQDQAATFTIQKSAPSPQHGQKSNTQAVKAAPPSRSFDPKAKPLAHP